MWEFLLYSLPWWLQIILMLAIVGVPTLLIAFMIFGTQATLRAVLPVLGVILTLGLASRFRQQGYTDRRAEEEKALDHAEDVQAEIEAKVHTLPDDKLNKKVDKWSR